MAFEKSGAVSDAKITPHTLNFVKKLVSTFGVGLENVSNVSTMFSSAASESLARRAQATAQDPVFQKMKGQFTTGQFAVRINSRLFCIDIGLYRTDRKKNKCYRTLSFWDCSLQTPAFTLLCLLFELSCLFT